MSDVQIITGIAIMISGLARLPCGLTCFEWQILVDLAWFSSLTHLSCLTILQNYLYNRPVERGWRLLLMLVLAIFIFFAFIPTTNYDWETWYDMEPSSPFHPAIWDYAICYLRPTSQSQTGASILSTAASISLIILGFIFRIIRLHEPLSSFMSKRIRGSLSEAGRSLLRNVFKWCDPHGPSDGLKRTLCYRPLLALFLAMRVILDIWSSMFLEVSGLFSLVS